MRPAAGDVESVVELGRNLGAMDFQVFFPVRTGRAQESVLTDPHEYETVIRQLLLKYRNSDVNLRPTCAPQSGGSRQNSGLQTRHGDGAVLPGSAIAGSMQNGDVTPCPYLPVSAGNIRETPFGKIWKRSPVFSALRDPELLAGNAGGCGYKTICGGCRARAYRGTGAVTHRWCDGLEKPGEIAGELCMKTVVPVRTGRHAMNTGIWADTLDLCILDALQEDITSSPDPGKRLLPGSVFRKETS
jgi:radical SAM protein with 4Fe4S-binding SPASM domain